MTPVLIAVVYTVVALLGICVVVTRDPMRQVVVNGLFGLSLALLFVVVQAPDVAISEIVVSSVAFPAVLLTAIHRAGEHNRRRTASRGEDGDGGGG